MTLLRFVLVATVAAGVAVGPAGCSGPSREIDDGRVKLSCLRTLTRECPSDGICGRDVFTSYPTNVSCDTGQANPHDGMVTEEVRTSDGALCYTIEFRVSFQNFCESAATTWKDPSGRVVATGWMNRSAQVTCADSGDSASCDSFDNACLNSLAACVSLPE